MRNVYQCTSGCQRIQMTATLRLFSVELPFFQPDTKRDANFGTQTVLSVMCVNDLIEEPPLIAN